MVCTLDVFSHPTPSLRTRQALSEPGLWFLSSLNPCDSSSFFSSDLGLQAFTGLSACYMDAETSTTIPMTELLAPLLFGHLCSPCCCILPHTLNGVLLCLSWPQSQHSTGYNCPVSLRTYFMGNTQHPVTLQLFISHILQPCFYLFVCFYYSVERFLLTFHGFVYFSCYFSLICIRLLRTVNGSVHCPLLQLYSCVCFDWFWQHRAWFDSIFLLFLCYTYLELQIDSILFYPVNYRSYVFILIAFS